MAFFARRLPIIGAEVQPRPKSLRPLTTSAAKELLGLCTKTDVSAKSLRRAYLITAKKCHPDLNHNSLLDFREVTAAYELLQSGIHVSARDDLGITQREEEAYRSACDDWLGLRAEVVEESKRCPVFRNWLEGKTDAAMYWNNFFALHGGLAPCLRPPSALISEGKEGSERTRRRRR